MSETWKPVYGWEGSYEVSDHGNVRSLDRYVTDQIRTRLVRGRILKMKIDKRGGYPTVSLCRPGQQRTRCVHTLVSEAFHGPRPSGLVVRHLNGDPTDNRIANLKWGTCAENTADMLSHGNAYWSNQTHCIHGHEFTPQNTRLKLNKKDGGLRRNCRTCDNDRSRRQVRKKIKHNKTCNLCRSPFSSGYKRAVFCSPECKKASRRVSYLRRDAA